ncbi:hypothetical protein [Jiella sp. M17.18]|uniref:hypothetical protein n=1 Tax=Jiella sp. M17.18 TaxID=3234247 RepID=UPI0034DF444D
MEGDLSRALDRLAAGDWDGAHAIVQDDPSEEAAWIHAHLHRIEGDLGNAAYWYRRAGRSMPSDDLDDERAAIMRELSRSPMTRG